MRETLTVLDPPAIGRTAALWIDALTSARAGSTGDPPLPTLLALLAAGRFDLVRAQLRHLHDPLDVPLVVARYAAWSGDLAAAAAIWQQVRTTTLQLAASAGEHAGEDRRLHVAATLAAVARTATDLGDPQLSAALHGPARRARERLPADLSASARLFAVASGLLEGGAGGDDEELLTPEGTTAAWGVLGLVHGLIGAEPDATRHRLRLRPRISAGFTSLHVRDIGFGDGTIHLAAERAGDTLLVRVGQDSGAIPATVLLEPVVTHPVAAAAVDGVTASLQPRAVPGGVLVPVQLVLDADRELRLELDARRPPG